MDRRRVGLILGLLGGLLILAGFLPLLVNPHENAGLAERLQMSFGAPAITALMLGAALVATGAYLAWPPPPEETELGEAAADPD